MIGIVDTSALVRLFIPDGPVPDGLEAFFRKVEAGHSRALAPGILAAEVASVVLKKQRLGELNIEEAGSVLGEMTAIPIEMAPHLPLVEDAYNLAQQNSLTIYDALFLALALEHNAVFFTADDRLARAAEAIQLAVNE
ncbi:MAG: type II toxin-antitoxin system VapC family toxin [Desulfobacterales bacterium]